jgi:hypothetical protein
MPVDPAARQRMQAGDSAQKRGLARSVLADQRRQATRLNGTGQARQDDARAMPQLDVFECNHSAHTTAAHTMASSMAARSKRAAAPAVGDNGSIMVTV